MAEVFLIKHNLRKLLPDFDLDLPELNRLLDSQFITYDTKVAKMLKFYLKRKRPKSGIASKMREEAKYIHRLFPTLTSEYILEKLMIFKDMPDRVEIVLRLILNNSKTHRNQQHHYPPAIATTDSLKRTSPIKLQCPATSNSNEYHSPIKIRRLADGRFATVKLVLPPDLKYKTAKSATVTSSSAVAANQGDAYSGIPSTSSALIPERDDTYPVIASSSSENSATADSSSEKPGKADVALDMPCIFVPPPQEPFPVAEESVAVIQSQGVSSDNKNASAFVAQFVQSPTDGIPNGVEKEEIVSSASDVQMLENEEIPENVNSVNSIGIKADLNNDETVDDGLLSRTSDFNKSLQELKKYLQETKRMLRNSNEVKSDVQSTNHLVLPPKDDTANNVVPQVVTLQNEQPDELHAASSVSSSNVPVNLPPLQTIAVSTEIPPQIEKREQPVPETASTSTAQDVNMEENGDDGLDFDLISYLHDITNAPVTVILKECRRFNVGTMKRPDNTILGMMVDSLLTNKISSDSDSDEYQEPHTPIMTIRQRIETLQEALEMPRDITKPSTSGSGKKVVVTVRENNNNSQKSSVIVKAGPLLLQPKEANVIDLENQKEAVTVSDKDVDFQLVNHLCSIFPDACPTYIKKLCHGKAMSNEVLDDITTVILCSNGNYPKRPPINVEPEVIPENQFEILRELLPDADPDFLRMKCDQFDGKPDLVKQFINEAMERRNYPTLKEHLRRQQLSAQERQYTTEFNVENFIKIIPDPHAFFSDPARVVKMDNLSSHYALVFLRNTFNRLPVRTIQCTFAKHKSNLYQTYKELAKITEKGPATVLMKSVRKPIEMPNSVQNIPLLQEIAYYSHLKAIDSYLKQIKEKEDAERQEALDQGLMKTCGCCYDEEVLPKEIFCCENNCAFCKNCIVKSTEVRFGEGKLDFPCLANCSSNFSLQTLQAALSPKLFSKIAQKKALEEIKSAGIEELESCPFCDFATIPAEGYNIFTCMNPECMKESCRLCKEPSHIPLRCDEIEKDEDVKARVFVENKMTEALLRKCWKCGIKFFKEEGCNKMTCSCGANMCYVCGQPVTDYKHFNGNGGDRFDLCPLYSDTNTMNKENVLKAAAAAKTEIGNKELKHDPTADVQEHYKQRAKKLPPPPIVNPVDVQNAAAAALAYIARIPPREHLHVYHERNHNQHHRHVQQHNRQRLQQHLQEHEQQQQQRHQQQRRHPDLW